MPKKKRKYVRRVAKSCSCSLCESGVTAAASDAPLGLRERLPVSLSRLIGLYQESALSALEILLRQPPGPDRERKLVTVLTEMLKD